MNSTTTTATSSSTDSAGAPPIERRWISVVFIQGEAAAAVLGMIDHDGPEAAIQHLSQWDYRDETRDAALANGYVYDVIPQRPTDHVIRDDASGHALTYHHPFGYMSLLGHSDPVVEDAREAAASPARLGLHRHRTARPTTGLRL